MPSSESALLPEGHMLTTDVPTYAIDLGNDEAKRWDEVIAHEKEVAGRLFQEAAGPFERIPELLRWVFARLYKSFGGLYRGEIAAWAEALGTSVGTATILNCAYELSHLRWCSAQLAARLRCGGPIVEVCRWPCVDNAASSIAERRR
jgi:hypothetical protein